MIKKARKVDTLTGIPPLSDLEALSPAAGIAAIGDIVEDLGVGVLAPVISEINRARVC